MALDTNTNIDETNRLIASDKVEGTAVYNRQGEKLGTIRNFMVEKRSGKVEYAVLSFGGILGMGDSYHPLPWNVLTYDTTQGGYVVDLDK
jgi:sporulation protein YlmC with PRC-barrel domain